MKITNIISVFCITYLVIIGRGCSNQEPVSTKIIIGETSVDPNVTATSIENSPDFQETSLLFEISSDKLIYRVGEDITIEMILSNLGPNPVVVKSSLWATSVESLPELNSVNFIVINPSGDIIPFGLRLNLPLPSTKDFVILEPSGNPLRVRQFGFEEIFDFSEIGIYTIQATYHNVIDSPDGREAWKGTLESNTITIEVVP